MPTDDTTTPAQTTIDTFLEVDIRTGRVLRAEPLPAARRPAIKILIQPDQEVEPGLRLL